MQVFGLLFRSGSNTVQNTFYVPFDGRDRCFDVMGDICHQHFVFLFPGDVFGHAVFQTETQFLDRSTKLLQFQII